MKKVFCFIFSSFVLIAQGTGVFIDGVAAVVENKIILKSDLNQMVNMLAIQNKINPNENYETYLKLQKEVLASMIDQKILLKLAEQDTTIIVKDKEVEQSLNQQVDNLIYQAGGKKEAEKILGQTIKSFRSEFWFDMRDKMVSERFQQKKLNNITTNKKDVERFYNTYKDSLPFFPLEAKIRHILLKPQPSDSIKKETKKLLYKLKNKILSGSIFKDIAKKYSMDPGSKNNGGDIGWVKRGSLLKNFETVAFTIKLNTLSDPVETEMGYHLLETLDKKGDKVKVRHILIMPEITKKDEEKTYNFGLFLKDSSKTLLNFKNLAKTYSKDEQTSNLGGNLGWIVPDTYPIKEIGKVISYLKVNECSPPINSTFGVHLLWIEKIKKGGKPSLKDHYSKIEMMALNNKKMNWYNNWIKNKKRSFYINIKI